MSRRGVAIILFGILIVTGSATIVTTWMVFDGPVARILTGLVILTSCWFGWRLGRWSK